MCCALGPTQPLFLAVLLSLLSACWQTDAGSLVGRQTTAPDDFRHLGRSTACYLEVGQPNSRAIRVNCFHIDGVLHIHSNRFAKMPRLRGESWVDSLRREPNARVAIAGDIYRMRATPIDDSERRVAILHDRGYPYAWDGITIFHFAPHFDPR